MVKYRLDKECIDIVSQALEQLIVQEDLDGRYYYYYLSIYISLYYICNFNLILLLSIYDSITLNK
jgi:hypothetical protein